MSQPVTVVPQTLSYFAVRLPRGSCHVLQYFKHGQENVFNVTRRLP